MDKEELQKNIALYYSKLTPKAQEVFSSMSWLETLKSISQKYNLDSKQIETLGTETTLLLLGIIHSEIYSEVLTRELVLPPETLEKVISEINQSIISPIKEELEDAFQVTAAMVSAEENETTTNTEDERLLSLPKEVRQIVEDSYYHENMYKISKEYNLTVAQMDVLEQDVTNLIIGVVSPDDFEKNLQGKTNLTPEKLSALVKDINERIFKVIRGKIMTANPKNIEKGEEMGMIDTEVLNKAGIEITPLEKKPEVSKSEITQLEHRDEILSKIETPEIIIPTKPTLNIEIGNSKPHPIIANKLSMSAKVPVKETAHSLNNISRKTESSGYTGKADPYRLSPEE